MRKIYIITAIFILAYALASPYFLKQMQERPLKLGYVPQGRLYKAALGEFRWITGIYFAFRAITYFGGKSKAIAMRRYKEIEYFNLFRTISQSIMLNPYNEDAYYFAQAAFIDTGHIKDLNFLLRKAFKYRPWDFQLPFFLGFNNAYFLKNYNKAAFYFKLAAKLTGSSLFTNLAARYFYEGGRTKLGISFLKYMIKTSHNKSVKLIYEKRLDALNKIAFLENAVKRYKLKFGVFPKNLNELVLKRIIKKIPEDPYHGKFFIKNGKIKTTSKLANPVKPERKNGTINGRKSS